MGLIKRTLTEAMLIRLRRKKAWENILYCIYIIVHKSYLSYSVPVYSGLYINYQSTISQQSVTQLLAGWPIKYYDLLANPVHVLSDSWPMDNQLSFWLNYSTVLEYWFYIISYWFSITHQAIFNVLDSMLNVHSTPVIQNITDTTCAENEPHIILTPLWCWTKAWIRKEKHN